MSNRVATMAVPAAIGAITVSLVCVAGSPPVLAQRAASTDPDSGVVTTGQRITPAGLQATFEGRTYGVAFGNSNHDVWVLVRTAGGAELNLLSTETNQVVRRLKVADRPGTQALTVDPASNQVFVGLVGTTVSNGSARDVVYLSKSGTQALAPAVNNLGRNQVGAVAIAAHADTQGRRIAVVPLTYNNQAAVVDVLTGRVLGRPRTEIAPFGAVINSNGTVAYVSNWGGRLVHPGDRTLTSGNPIEADATDKPSPDPVVVDDHGIASTGSITRLDVTTMRATTSIAVGLHPTAMTWDEAHARLYVANSNSDSISVIDTTTDRVVQTIALQPFQQRRPGIAPTALAIDTRSRRLYAACGGINAVAVVEAATGELLGLIPTAWYPSALSLSADGKRLAVGALLGEGSGWQISGATLTNYRRQYEAMHVELPRRERRYVHAYRGTVNVIDLPNATALASLTAAVAQNNRLTLASAAPISDLAPRPDARPRAIPERVGEPSLIRHVVYIIKENRTYDQLFGDLGKGNGDPALVMYGQRVTPNQRRLANEFVLLDNFYATGGNSGDGHQWATQANETEYTLWPGYAGRSYPYGGDDPIAVARGGFIWDEALRQHKTVQLFGEYVGYGYPANPGPEDTARLKRLKRGDATAPGDAFKERVGEELKRKVAAWRAGTDFSGRWHNVAPNDALNAIMVHDYPAWGVEEIPDVVRAQVFNAHLKQWEAAGEMPNLSILHLPSDHTEGTAPHRPTPRASVADNDWALGLIVEALTHSRFWPTMAIFVVEDDAQNGVDHVDGHRTVALTISPYSRRGAVDSLFYAHQGMLKTIELILGLSPLSIFDLTATEMRGSFQDTPNLTPYAAVEPEQSIVELNPPVNAVPSAARQGALASARMRWDVVDAAPSETLNRILWHDARGWNTPYPQIRNSVFSPFALDVPDEDREPGDEPTTAKTRARRR